MPITWIKAHKESQINVDSIFSLHFANKLLITLFFFNTKGDSKLKFFSKHTRNGIITLLEGAEGGGKKSLESFLLFSTTQQPLTD
jgi:hypothetical protein